jgi:molybdopterin converting factor small subunit
MKIELRMFLGYSKYLPSDAVNGRAEVILPEGATLGDLLALLAIPDDSPKSVMINSMSCGYGTAASTQLLKEGDTVVIFPPVAGG